MNFPRATLKLPTTHIGRQSEATASLACPPFAVLCG